MATKNAGNRQTAALYGSVFLERLERVGRAGRVESACRRLERRYHHPIYIDEEYQRQGKEPFHESSGKESGLTKQMLELSLPFVEAVNSGVQDHSHIVSRQETCLSYAPAFSYDSPRLVPCNRVGIGPDGNEHRPIRRETVRHDMDPHAFAGKTGSASENLLNFRPFPEPIGLGKPLPGDFDTSNPEGPISRASSRRKRSA